jgi:PASTA domain
MQNTDPTPIVGVFKDQAKADQAVEELKQAGFTEDRIASKVVSQQTAPGEQTAENTRIFVTVSANGNEKQAFGILFNSGANNADLPHGMSIDGNVLSSQEETDALIPKPELEGSFSKDSYFGEEKDLGQSDQLGQMDKL